MKKAYYLFNPGRVSRKDNTLKFLPEITEKSPSPKPRYLPIEGISALYIFGSVDANSAMYNYLGQKHIPVHFFDYYKHYTGSFSPREYLLAGDMLIKQTDAYRSKKKRQHIASQFVDGATFNILKNLRYYNNRGRDLSTQIAQIETLRQDMPHAQNISQLMGLEGN
ncbi:MAG: CRISPR-associated endonuclease Cas1, partial [Bacteroidota bacterium]